MPGNKKYPEFKTQGEYWSVLPPNFKDYSLLFAQYGKLRYCLPLTRELRWSLLGQLCFRQLCPFGPLLKGYFASSFTKIFTCHLLSLHPDTAYSSSSLHLKSKVKNIIRFLFFFVNQKRKFVGNLLKSLEPASFFFFYSSFKNSSIPSAIPAASRSW